MLVLGSRRPLLFGCLLAVTLHAFDELAVVTAMPVLVEDLGGRALYGAVFFAYLLASIVGLVCAGWAAARYGPAQPFGWGLAVFAVGLVVGALAPTMPVVVAGRALQGLGGGTVSTVVLVIVNRAFDDSERPRVLAWTTTAWVVPALLAPAAAGWVAETWSWRWVFVGLLPLTALAGLLALPATRGFGGGETPRGFRAEISDGVRLAAGLGLVLASLSRALSPLSVAGFVCGAALGVAPLRRVLPSGVWHARPVLPAAIAAKILLAFAFFGAEAFVPLALGDVHGVPAAYAGLALTTAAISWTGAAFVQSRLAATRPAWGLAGTGGAMVLGGVATLTLILAEGSPPELAFAAWLVAGAGMGLAYNTFNATVMEQTPTGGEGVTSTALGVADAVGISLGTGIGGALLALGDRAGWSTGDSLALVWPVMAFVAAFAVAITRRLRAPTPAEQPAA